MKCKNDFKEKDRELFFWNRECWVCGKFHTDCLHHIMGRASDSPLNAAPLNNFDCHIGNGKLSLFEVKKRLLKKTLDYLLENDYVLTKKDKEFKSKYKKYYN